MRQTKKQQKQKPATTQLIKQQNKTIKTQTHTTRTPLIVITKTHTQHYIMH